MPTCEADGRNSGSLDLDKGIPDPRGSGACQRWPEGFWLLNETTGEMCVGCCRATNLCDCARRRYLRETVRMLAIDAAERPPTIFAVLTAREHLVKDADLMRTMEQVLKALRRRWPVEWFCRWEQQARGALHVNLLVKGVPEAEWRDFARVLVERWCTRVDAEPSGQYCEPIIDGTAVTLYVAKKVLHAGKSNQEPHLRHKHRTSQTRGYLVRPASVMRQEARDSLAMDAFEYQGCPPEFLELELEALRAQVWSLARRNPAGELLKVATDGRARPADATGGSRLGQVSAAGSPANAGPPRALLPIA